MSELSSTEITEGHGSPVETDAQAVVDIATLAAQPAPLPDVRHSVITVPAGGTATVVDRLALEEKYNPVPNRKIGAAEAHDAASFAAYVVKHGIHSTEVWANERSRTLVAVLNAGDAAFEHAEGDAGWGDHRITYQATPTPEWQAWTKHDGKMLHQVEFAEHIEDHLRFIVDPPSLDMLEVAQSIEGSKDATFKSRRRLNTGEVQLSYEETINAQSASTNTIDIPEIITIRLAPYEGAEVVDIQLRFRLRIDGGNLRLGYKVVDREQIERDAFRSVVSYVNDVLTDTSGAEDGLSFSFRPVLMGVAATAQRPLA